MTSCSGNSSSSGCHGGANPFAAELFPSIVQSFALILLGYLSARFGLLNSANANGIGKYITNFALPAVFFQAMVTIDFGGVNWYFLGAIFLSKAIMFLATFVLALIISRPVSLSVAGILGVFTSQSNDVALGYPIMVSLLPDLAHYIYLAAPIQLAVINPVAFTMMEIQAHWDAKRRVGPYGPEAVDEAHGEQPRSSVEDNPTCNADPPSRRRRCLDSMACRIFKGVALNPLVFMTLIGVPFNFILNRKIPEVINKALTVLAQSFAGTALFVLGFNMMGKLNKLCRRKIYLLAMLLLGKLVVTPFLMYQLVEALNSHTHTNASLQYRLFAFLYGGLPTAPPVFLFASQYHAAVDVVASGLVLGTFISFPWTYISARLVTLAVMKETDYSGVIRSTSFNVSILSIICVIWVLVIFALSRRFRRMPHVFTTLYLISILMATGGTIGSQVVMDNENPSKAVTMPWSAYLPFLIFFVGVIGTRTWILIIGIVLAFLKMRGLCFVLYYRWVFFLSGFGTPVLLTGVLLMFGSRKRTDIDPAFQFGNSQLIASLVALIGCLLGTVGVLVVILRHESATPNTDVEELLIHSSPGAGASINSGPSNRREFLVDWETDDHSGTGDVSGGVRNTKATAIEKCWRISLQNLFRQAVTLELENTEPVDDSSPDVESPRRVGAAVVGSPFDDESEEAEHDASLEEWLGARRCTLSQHMVSAEQQRICQRNLIKYRKSTRSFLQEAGEAGLGDVDREYQTHEHIVLFILAIVSMFMGVLLCLWRLVNESLTGVYLMLEFLDSIFNFGQGFFAFALFGLDTDLIILPFKKRWRKFLYGVEEIHVPPEDHLDAEIILARQQFVKYHLKKCRKDLVGRRRYHLAVYDDVFRGDHFVSWLKRVGLASDDIEALAYGQKLLYARVFFHVKREHHLHNLPYFYRFSNEFDDLQASPTDESPLVNIDDADGYVQPARRRTPLPTSQ